jgi:hypothetical protein
MHGGHADKEDWKHGYLNKVAMSFEAVEIFIQTSLKSIQKGWLTDKSSFECQTCVKALVGQMS